MQLNQFQAQSYFTASWSTLFLYRTSHVWLLTVNKVHSTNQHVEM